MSYEQTSESALNEKRERGQKNDKHEWFDI